MELRPRRGLALVPLANHCLKSTDFCPFETVLNYFVSKLLRACTVETSLLAALDPEEAVLLRWSLPDNLFFSRRVFFKKNATKGLEIRESEGGSERGITICPKSCPLPPTADWDLFRGLVEGYRRISAPPILCTCKCCADDERRAK